MKNEKILHFIAVTVFAIFIVLGLACATAPAPENAPYKPAGADEKILGNVSAKFEAAQEYGGDVLNKTERNEAAYIALLEAAQKAYQGNIDVRNIRWTKGKHISGFPPTAIWAVYEYTANGSVISLGGVNASQVEGALDVAAKEIAEDFPARARIAIVYITSQDRSTTEYIIGELEHLLRRQGFYIVDRSELDRIRDEQRFGISGEVDDKTAARMGHLSGASIVITGRVDGEGNLRRLRLRALDTTTGQVVGTASQRL
jgi:hypothetical protein